MPGRGEPWDELEYRELFDRFPVRGDRPAGDALRALSRRLDRSEAAVIAQWDDAATYCRGSATVASDGLQSYLDRIGLCRE
jgi:hypothetical protein